MKKITIYLLIAGSLLAAGCEKKETATTGKSAREYLNLWMQEYHPGISATSSGVYILEDQPGTGATWNSDKPYTMMIITIRGLDGKVTSTGHEDVAKQVGTFVEGNYYGPVVSYTENGYVGVEALLAGMAAGGTRTAVVPSWLLTTTRQTSLEDYLTACTSSKHLIYTLTFTEQTDDISVWEQTRLRQYVTEHFGASVQSASFNEDTEQAPIFYFVSDESQVTDKTAMESGTKYKLNYTGRLLNGQVFDTTIEKVAKDSGIYNSANTYEPVTITTAESYENYALGGSTSLVNGFKGALSMLKYPGQKGVGLFTSTLGYTDSGSGSKIPAYAPLCFELEVVSIVESN